MSAEICQELIDSKARPEFVLRWWLQLQHNIRGEESCKVRERGSTPLDPLPRKRECFPVCLWRDHEVFGQNKPQTGHTHLSRTAFPCGVYRRRTTARWPGRFGRAPAGTAGAEPSTDLRADRSSPPGNSTLATKWAARALIWTFVGWCFDGFSDKNEQGPNQRFQSRVWMLCSCPRNKLECLNFLFVFCSDNRLFFSDAQVSFPGKGNILILPLHVLRFEGSTAVKLKTVLLWLLALLKNLALSVYLVSLMLINIEKHYWNIEDFRQVVSSLQRKLFGTVLTEKWERSE